MATAEHCRRGNNEFNETFRFIIMYFNKCVDMQKCLSNVRYYLLMQHANT